jgi:mRNA interferase RelE/StbE
LAVKIEYKASVERDFRKVGQTAALRVQKKIEKTLAEEGRQGEALSGEFAGLFRLRVGDYRVVYAPTEEGYLVLRVGHRRDVYKKGRP